ncbi:MAG: HDOD domain-containing protein [Sulfuricurvum sp.]|uniref:HDOD domain-containing protein n=1 Tax=Sulfuricurvum sp. TaxID=2025608 RepID=UPI0025DCFF80|nr:HDOD domain-containing protein [Sulfuricurvum sp.]MCI4407144.1 HDOD domain-containing protein [Sulfuricurvum sp.]
MVTKDEIERYIQNIPPAPTIVKQTLDYVRLGDLTKAAKCAEEDPALKLYLKTLVNRPVYGFRNEVSDVSQIFGILGVSTAQQILYNYLMSVLVPKQWELFHLTHQEFYDLQAALSAKWTKILTHLSLLNRESESAITLLPASIIVCDALFGAHKSEVEQLKSVKALDYNTILYRLCRSTLFDICTQIALKWEIPPLISRIVHAASGNDQDLKPTEKVLAQWMHLLLFFELSQGTYVSAGLNEFIEFKIEFVQDIYETFMQVVEYDESNG